MKGWLLTWVYSSFGDCAVVCRKGLGDVRLFPSIAVLWLSEKVQMKMGKGAIQGASDTS